jgi:cell wall-associated NlpC family hydrolase
MKLFKILIIITLFCSLNAVSQKIIKHKIKSGESIYGIALKHDLTESEMYAANPKTKGTLLQLGQIINIPNKKYKEKEKSLKKDKKELPIEKKANKQSLNEVKDKKAQVIASKETTNIHEVLTQETLYSLSKEYGISMEAICEMNPVLKTTNLKKGAKLKFPNKVVFDEKDEKNKEIPNVNEDISNNDILTPNIDIVHKVLPKETLYRISKQYNVTIVDLEKLNPGIENGLPVDYNLVIKKGLQSPPEQFKETVDLIPNDEIVDVKNIPAGNIAKAELLIGKASEHLGTHYRAGGTTSTGFDCSGLMFTTFKNVDITLPRSSSEMAHYGVRIDKAHAQKGDLIFFATFGGRRVSHVGMITEVKDDGEINFIHSSTSTGVIVSSIREPYYARTFVQVNRVIIE